LKILFFLPDHLRFQHLASVAAHFLSFPDEVLGAWFIPGRGIGMEWWFRVFFAKWTFYGADLR